MEDVHDAQDRGGIRPWAAAATDLVVVVVFVLIGRRTHHEDSGVSGFFRVLWPFAIGLVAGWLVSGLVRSPLAYRRAVVAWLITVGVGVALRVAVQGHEFKLSFVIVATMFLGALLLGWRASFRWLASRRGRVSTR